MGWSVQEANEYLSNLMTQAEARGETISKQDLDSVISRLDVGCPGETTLLYSGPLSDGTGSHQLAQQMLAGVWMAYAGLLCNFGIS